MPARDFYHDVVKLALIADGWTITHDPFVLQWGSKDLFVDLGAEPLAGRGQRGSKDRRRDQELHRRIQTLTISRKPWDSSSFTTTSWKSVSRIGVFTWQYPGRFKTICFKSRSASCS